MSGDERGYNGWTNYPTWSVHLWVTNEPAPYDYALDLARTALEDDLPRVALADALKDWLRGRLEPQTACLQADLLGYALDGVNWTELADAFLEAVEELSEA